MNKSDSAIPCRITGPDGKVLWSGTIADMRRDARKLREMNRRRKGDSRGAVYPKTEETPNAGN